MRDELHLMELVDRYLDGEMQDHGEREAFEKRVGTNNELRALVDEQRALREGLHRTHLRSAAALAHRSWILRRTIPWAAGGVILLGIVGYAVLSRSHEMVYEPLVAAAAMDTSAVAVPAVEDSAGTGSLTEETRVESVFMHAPVKVTAQGGSRGSGTIVSYQIGERGDTTSTTVRPATEGPQQLPDMPSDRVRMTPDTTLPHERPQVKARPLIATMEIPADADVQPAFPGGMDEMQRYIADHVKQPRGRRNSGSVTVGFTVNKKGEVVNVNVVSGMDPAFDAEAVRVIESMPRWSPARVGERPVKSKVQVPVWFVGKGKGHR